MKKTIFLILIILLSSILPPSGWVQSSRDFYIEEHQKSIMNETPAGQDQRTSSNNAKYKSEEDLIIRQLEIITGDEETRYIIVPGDTLSIYYNDRNKRPGAAYVVNSKGEIQMPLIGAVKISGLNRKDSREKTNELLSQYIRKPDVDLRINVAGRFMVIGAVHTPGVYRIEQNLTILEAIYNARGPVENKAKMNSVLLIRGGKDNPVITRLDLKKVLKKGDQTDNVLLKPGDMVFVPTSFIFHLDQFQKTMYRHILTYYGLGGTVPLKNP